MPQPPRRTVVARRPTRRRHAEPARRRAAIDTVVVTVPARNERAAIRGCLAALDRAAARVAVEVLVVVAADTCRDGTADVARAAPMTTARRVVIEGSWRGAAAARRAGVATGCDLVRSRPGGLWLASTDADCVVDDDWLERQLVHAAAGRDAVAGIVRLDETAPARLRADFAAAYRVSGPTHRHVHAANMGVRAEAFADAGGWYVHAVVGEEHRLWRRLGSRGWRTIQPTDVVVTTSARTHGRVVGGFASALARLDGDGARGAERTA